MNTQINKLEKFSKLNTKNISLLTGMLLGLLLAILTPVSYAGGTNSNYTAIPPILATGSKTPSVLVVLDNSNSMDEAPSGRAVGSDNSGSKSEIARDAVENIITNFTGKIRMGLMAYQQSGVSSNELHNFWYDASYDPTNYNSSYNLTIPGARDSNTKKYRTLKPGSSTEYVYYNVEAPLYSGGNLGTKYCYSSTADFDNGSESPTSGPWDNYYCFNSKSGTSDTIPNNPSSAGSAGYSSAAFGGSPIAFTPTDTDFALQILDFGQRVGWYYVGKTWFSNGSPGKGFLHIPVKDLDATQASKLNTKLGKSQFTTNSPTGTSYPLQNAGLTPLVGTLDSALRYFNGTGVSSSETSSDTTYTPVTGGCGEEKYIVLVTDGLPSVDINGSTYAYGSAGQTAAINDVANKAAALKAIGVKVYVVGFALPAVADPTLLDQIASAGGTGTAYSASDSTSLNATLNAIFLDIQGRTSSGSAAAVVSNSGQGTGAIYQALYNAKKTSGSNEVKWIGKLHSLFIDDRGYFREDANGNAQLDGYTTDYVVEVYYDSVSNTTKYQRYTSSDGGVTLVASGAPIDFDNILPIWNASTVLGGLDQSSIVTQRTYSTAVSSSSGGGRHILTNINGTVMNFEWDGSATPSTSKISANNYRYLGVNSTSEAANIVNFIRGKEGISGYRSRTLNGTRYLLGDIIHSSPTVVGAPNEGYNTTHADDSYAEFRNKYTNRRQVVYVGGNDGMIHAFNAGFWDETNKAYKINGGTGITQHPLGAELWAFIPQNLLPHLQWLKDTDYSHVYYMDGSPLVFDANIFANDSTHTNGWGTVLVIGMRLGGGAMTVDTDGDSVDDWTTASSYIVLDITDPEQPPTFIAELSPSGLGLTTSKPVVVKKRAPSTVGNWKDFSNMTNEWYLVFGSGAGPNGSPSQAQTAITNVVGDTVGTEAKIYMYNLGDPKPGTPVSAGYVSGYATGKSTGLTYSFVGDLSVADWDNDYKDDAVYFGTVGKSGSATTEGDLYRLRISNNTLYKLLAVGKPLVSSPLISIDNIGNKWIHAGTGRLFSLADNSTSAQQYFIGAKEPLSSGSLTYATVTFGDLLNVTGVKVFANNTVQDTNSVLVDGSGNPLAIATFSDLETHIQNNNKGWYLKFPTNGGNPSTRSVSAATRVNRFLLFTDYTPSGNVCSPEGTSSLYVANLKTGTSEGFAPLGLDPLSTYGGSDEAILKINLGTGLATTPSVHTGANTSPAGGVKVITNTSTGALSTKFVTLPPVSGGRQTWREIEQIY